MTSVLPTGSIQLSGSLETPTPREHTPSRTTDWTRENCRNRWIAVLTDDGMGICYSSENVDVRMFLVDPFYFQLFDLYPVERIDLRIEWILPEWMPSEVIVLVRQKSKQKKQNMKRFSDRRNQL